MNPEEINPYCNAICLMAIILGEPVPTGRSRRDGIQSPSWEAIVFSKCHGIRCQSRIQCSRLRMRSTVLSPPCPLPPLPGRKITCTEQLRAQKFHIFLGVLISLKKNAERTILSLFCKWRHFKTLTGDEFHQWLIIFRKGGQGYMAELRAREESLSSGGTW